MSDFAANKMLIRQRALRARAAQANKEEVSRLAIDRLIALPEYQRAGVVMWYIAARSELRTQATLPRALASGKRIVVPYCTSDGNGEKMLGLWLLHSLDELVVGKWQILEPPRDRWSEVPREVQPEQLDFVLVPGVAFDRHGGRIGNGQGYYDRLLSKVRTNCCLVAPCYECQLVTEIPMQPHDIRMDKIVTEMCCYEGRGRSA